MYASPRNRSRNHSFCNRSGPDNFAIAVAAAWNSLNAISVSPARKYSSAISSRVSTSGFGGSAALSFFRKSSAR